ncbi:beta carbonic anhydrase 5, chloroplastic-like [Neltuma alba]|uniref:beta carbonic anhydrase 5, chloroplastic-like n=1 Tax=Neltuma alba TaxID=207710 RepID=UPI0010A42B58|nr:beta carbonic anhydrase 5, chloroplastic-like [Prosopis alba]XP_028771685.1 beta carbonic anhydrase 5, chloroplastic-like [Prosopis alba]XP_028785421.1 beta carbonic anhydrase 5, chloroplastic-like [Prosopis alba]
MTASAAPISVSGDPFVSISKPLALPLPFNSSCIVLHGATLRASRIFRFKLEIRKTELTHLRLLKGLRSNKTSDLKASMGPPGFNQQQENKNPETMTEAEKGLDLFNDLKDRFLSFKKNKYMGNLEHFQNLAQAQFPKFMVIACADSRVCPSYILGFQPGEAFMIRNVANLVTSFENGPSETNAALEFAVTTLKVENILVIGHSCCGGIRALMGMQDDANGSLLESWVVAGKNARIKTETAASGLDFDQRCRHCEKESLNHSLLNLLTYPWIEERVSNGELLIHGGYYDFVECSFEKWTVDYMKMKTEGTDVLVVKDRVVWC